MRAEVSASLAMTPAALSRRHSHRMVLRYHEVFGQWHVANLRAYVPHERGYFVVKTNRDGMRSNRDHDYENASGRARVLVFGDSFTAGEGVNNEERFSDRLEALLGNAQVLNFGLDGSGTDQQALILERLGGKFERDLILFCPLVENIRRIACRYWPAVDRASGQTVLVPKPYFVFEDGRLALHHVPVPKERPAAAESPQAAKAGALSGRLFGKSALELLGPLQPWVARWKGYQPFPQYDSPESPEWRLTVALLERVVELSGGCPVVVAPLPMFYQIEGISPATYVQRYREFADQHPEVHLIDVLPRFLRLPAATRRRCRYAHDVHYTPLGHELVAHALNDELRRRRLLSIQAIPVGR